MLTAERYDGDGREWDAYAEAQADASYAHWWGWGDVIGGALGHRWTGWIARDGAGHWEGLLPLVRVRTPFLGHYLISVPFVNGGGPLGHPEARDLLPRLADRGDDLLLLVAHFTRLFAERLGKSITGISDRALETLREHRWIGNVRELRNVIERAVLAVDGATLRSEHLPEEPRAMAPEALTRMPGGLGTLAEVEARHIARVLAHTGGQIGSAAEILGIHRNTLTRKIREYGL